MRPPSIASLPGQNHLAVVITMHDNPRLLPRIFDALSSQTGMSGRRWHVIVVDNGSREGIPKALMSRSFRFRLTVLQQRHTGQAWARNEGWKRADAPIVLFMDDDLVPDHRVLAEHLEAHRTNAGAVVLGTISLAGTAPPRPWIEYDRGGLAAKYAALAGREKPSGIHVGGNFSLPFLLLEGAGGFDHRLPGRDHVDLGFRLKQMGARFVYQPAAHAIQHSLVDYERWQAAHSLQGRLDVALFRDRGYAGGLPSVVACFHDRNPLNRIAVRLALSSDALQQTAVGWAGGMGRFTLRLGLRRLSLAAMSVVANIQYWCGVRDGLRGNARFWELVRATRRTSARTYERVRKAAT